MGTKKKPLIILGICIIFIIIIAFFMNGYKSTERTLWKAIETENAKKIISMCPKDFVKCVKEEIKSSTDYITNNLYNDLKKLNYNYDELSFYDYQVYQKGEFPEYVESFLSDMSDIVDYEVEPSKCVSVKVDFGDYIETDYCIKIGNKWYSLEAMRLVYTASW